MGIKKKKLQKEVEMQKKIVCKYNSQDFAQTQRNFARSHDRETVTFRNSVWCPYLARPHKLPLVSAPILSYSASGKNMKKNSTVFGKCNKTIS